MPTAHEVATELRKLADALDKSPETSIIKPQMYFPHSYSLGTPEQFRALAKILPHPLKKDATRDEFKISYNSEALRIQSYIERRNVCILVTPAIPAVYECPSILSEDEETEFEQEDENV